MNRSLLLVVCDFLLLSLLALANFEQTGQPVTTEEDSAVLVEAAESGQDEAMMNLLASALAAEQSSQAELEEKLQRAEAELVAMESSREELSETLTEKESAIAEREQLLAEREQMLAEVRAQNERIARERAAAEAQASAIQAERDRLATERAQAAAEAEQLASTVEDLASRADTSEAELQKRTEELTRLEAALAERSRELQLAERRQAEIETERQRLANEVATAEREKQLLTSSLDTARETIGLERQEKEQLRQQAETLTEGVSRLAEASTEITEEVRSLRPKSTNEIYREANENRVQLRWEGSRSGLFGDSPFEESVDTVITRIDGRPILWVQLSQTPFADPERRKFIRSLNAYLEAGDTRFRIPQMGILDQDRTLLFLPLTEEIVDRLEVKTFAAAADPFRFEDMVVVDLPESRFGESGFRIDTAKPSHLEVDSRVFSALFGQFSPSAGNLAFTRAGEFLGIVTRPGEAWMVEPVRTGGKIDFGEKFSRGQLGSLP